MCTHIVKKAALMTPQILLNISSQLNLSDPLHLVFQPTCICGFSYYFIKVIWSQIKNVVLILKNR